MLTISALARRFGLSRSALLHYDRIGLLKPTGRSARDHRRYSEADAQRLEAICTYRRAGVPLAEVRALLEAPDRSLAPTLERRLRELEGEMGRLREQARLVVGLLRRPELLEGLQAMDKAAWVGLLRASGFTDADMDRWHRAFEARDPERHQRFLAFLDLSPEEAAALRARSRERPPGAG